MLLLLLLPCLVRKSRRRPTTTTTMCAIRWRLVVCYVQTFATRTKNSTAKNAQRRTKERQKYNNKSPLATLIIIFLPVVGWAKPEKQAQWQVANQRFLIEFFICSVCVCVCWTDWKEQREHELILFVGILFSLFLTRSFARSLWKERAIYLWPAFYSRLSRLVAVISHIEQTQ